MLLATLLSSHSQNNAKYTPHKYIYGENVERNPRLPHLHLSIASLHSSKFLSVVRRTKLETLENPGAAPVLSEHTICPRASRTQGDARQGGKHSPRADASDTDQLAALATMTLLSQRKVVCVYSRPEMARRCNSGRGHPTCSLLFCWRAQRDAFKRHVEQKAGGAPSPQHSTCRTSGKAGEGQRGR